MKNIVTLIASVLLLAACSAPKYSYHFYHYDYNSGKRKAEAEKILLAHKPVQLDEVAPLSNDSPLKINKDAAVATTENAPSLTTSASVNTLAVEKKYSEMTKSEKKEFRKALKVEIKKYAKAKKSGVESVADTKVMDYNLKMAIIFGAVALTLSFFGGVNSVFWVASVICLVVGVVFFVKWIAEQ